MPNSEVKRSCADDTASITTVMFYERLSAAKVFGGTFLLTAVQEVRILKAFETLLYFASLVYVLAKAYELFK